LRPNRSLTLPQIGAAITPATPDVVRIVPTTKPLAP